MFLAESLTDTLPPQIWNEVDATPGWLAREEAQLLFNLAKQVTSGCIVEVGSYRGRSTVALSHGAKAGHQPPVFAVEPHEEFVGELGGQFGCEDRAAFFQTMLRTRSYENVRLVNLSSELITPNWQQPVAMLWLDGDHSFEGVSRDFQCWRDHLPTGAVIVFDDATDQRLGPYRLIEELINAGKVRKLAAVGKVLATIKT